MIHLKFDDVEVLGADFLLYLPYRIVLLIYHRRVVGEQVLFYLPITFMLLELFLYKLLQLYQLICYLLDVELGEAVPSVQLLNDLIKLLAHLKHRLHRRYVLVYLLVKLQLQHLVLVYYGVAVVSYLRYLVFQYFITCFIAFSFFYYILLARQQQLLDLDILLLYLFVFSINFLVQVVYNIV